MTKRVKATIEPSVLEWARTSAAYSVQAAAEKIGVDEEVLSAWEAGVDNPTVSQLRKLADVYKRPLAVLYLPEPPTAFKPMHDFRRLPAVGLRSYSPELAYETGFSSQVSLTNTGGTPTGADNVFVADTNRGAASAGSWGGPWVELRWLSRHDLLVLYDAKARVFTQNESVSDVSIRYEKVLR